MTSTPGPRVPGGFYRGGRLLLSLFRLFFHDGRKIHLEEMDNVTVAVFSVWPGSVQAATTRSVGAQVIVEIFMRFVTERLHNRRPHLWRGVWKVNEERHTYFLRESRLC